MKTIYLIIMCIAASACSLVNIEPEYGYIIFDVRENSTDNEKTYWLALCCDNSTNIHLASNESFHRVPSGKYWIVHIDASPNFMNPLDNIEFTGTRGIPVIIEKDKINYLGVIEHLSDAAQRKKIKFRHDTTLFEKICDENPHIFSTYGVTIPLLSGPEKNFEYSCSGV